MGQLLTETAKNSSGAESGKITHSYDVLGRTTGLSKGGITDSYGYTNGYLTTVNSGGTVQKTYGRNGNVLTYTLKDSAGNISRTGDG